MTSTTQNTSLLSYCIHFYYSVIKVLQVYWQQPFACIMFFGCAYWLNVPLLFFADFVWAHFGGCASKWPLPASLVASVWCLLGLTFHVLFLSGLLYMMLQGQQEWKLPSHILLVRGTHKTRPGSEGGEIDSIYWWVDWQQQIYGHF